MRYCKSKRCRTHIALPHGGGRATLADSHLAYILNYIEWQRDTFCAEYAQGWAQEYCEDKGIDPDGVDLQLIADVINWWHFKTLDDLTLELKSNGYYMMF